MCAREKEAILWMASIYMSKGAEIWSTNLYVGIVNVSTERGLFTSQMELYILYDVTTETFITIINSRPLTCMG